MLCEMCHEKPATVHLTENRMAVDERSAPSMSERHFCEGCADRYFASRPETNPLRGLIQLSDDYRSKLYDELEVKHPSVFTWWRTPSGTIANLTIMRDFLKERLREDRVEVTGDGFEMLRLDLTGSAEFNERRRKHSGPER
jgi:hypothetical protein